MTGHAPLHSRRRSLTSRNGKHAVSVRQLQRRQGESMAKHLGCRRRRTKYPSLQHTCDCLPRGGRSALACRAKVRCRLRHQARDQRIQALCHELHARGVGVQAVGHQALPAWHAWFKHCVTAREARHL